MTKDNTKEVKTVIEVECEGKSIHRIVYERWFKDLTLSEIADETEKAVKDII